MFVVAVHVQMLLMSDEIYVMFYTFIKKVMFISSEPMYEQTGCLGK